MLDKITYLERKEIDTARWDACIDRTAGGLIYSYSYYLDCMCDNWDGLVLNDYEAVMPLTWKKKWSICYLYQPFLTAQTGITGTRLSNKLVQDFLMAVPKKFSFWEVSLNHQNNMVGDNYTLHLRMNYVLHLAVSYDQLFSNYNQNTKRNANKAIRSSCAVKRNILVADVIDLAKKYTPGIAKHSDELVQFIKLNHILKQENKQSTYGVYSANNELLAAAIFFFSHDRAYYILAATHPNGKTLGASHLLIDSFIKDHAEQNLVLDFEGSDQEGLALFYSSFGAKEEKYPALRLNRLPWYAKLFKK